MKVLCWAGRAGLWSIAVLLWLCVALAGASMFWFMFVGPDETEHVASIWLLIGLVFATPALLLTAWLGGFWHQVFPTD